MQRICEKPPIEKSSLNTGVVNALMRAGYAKTKAIPLGHFYDGLVFDWKRIKSDEHNLKKIRNFGGKGFAVVQTWLALVEKEYPELIGSFTPHYTSARSVAQGGSARRTNELLPELEQCVIDMAQNGTGDLELMEIQLYFFLNCFGTYFEQERAKQIMLHVKQTAERFMFVGFN
jgi:hypothetical protein